MNNPGEAILKRLAEPFPPDRVSWRVGSTNQDKTQGLALAYIDARDVMERLDALFGINWQCRYSHAEAKTVCEIGIKPADEWIWRADGAGNSDVEAEKGALSDAFKRAAVKWGIGRYLYDLDSPWVKLEQKGRSHIIAKSEMSKLKDVLLRATGAKNAPGISAAKTWANEFIRDAMACESAEKYQELLTGCRTHLIRIAAVYPNLWAGPNGGGVKYELQRIGTIMEAREFFDPFMVDVEIAAKEVNQQQAAE